MQIELQVMKRKMSIHDSKGRGTEGMAERGGMPWLPDWIREVGVPVWVSGPDKRVWALNERAEKLFGMTFEECIGKPCFDVVSGDKAYGLAFCSSDCEVRSSAEEGREVEPVTIQLGGDDTRRRWIQVLVIPIRSPEGGSPWLVHCALDAERAHCMQEYLAKVATRNAAIFPEGGSTAGRDLTRREKEVLRHLADDQDLRTIARMLHLSHATVRNHIQHILKKLEVHSIQEAVAVYILGLGKGPR